MRLLELPDALREMGVEPVLVAGWERRGVPYEAKPVLTLRHHTAGPMSGRVPSLGTVTNGRPDLPYNLCTVLQSREGGGGLDKAYVVSSGVAIHAGAGEWAGRTSGNRGGTGLEVEHSGRLEEPWPANRVETSERIVAACQMLSADPAGKWCCEHREFALPRGRKPDTRLSGSVLRANVDLLLDPGPAPSPAPVPAPTLEVEMYFISSKSSGLVWLFEPGRRTLIGPASDDVIKKDMAEIAKAAGISTDYAEVSDERFDRLADGRTRHQ